MRSLRIFAVLAVLAAHLLLIAMQNFDVLPAWLAELTRFLPWYWMVVPMALIVPLAWGLPFGLLWLALANLALLLTLTMGLQLNYGSKDNTAGLRLRVLTFNVKALNARHRDNGIADIEQEIQAHQADIVALQDAQHLVPHMPGGGPGDAPPMLGLAHVVGVDQYVLASRFPLHNCKALPMPPRVKEDVMLMCEAEVAPGKKLTVMTVHLVSPRASLLATRQEGEGGLDVWRNNFATRLIQVQAVLKVISKIQGPLLVMGDFNASEDSPVIETLKLRGLHDTFADAGQGYGYTYGHALARGLDFLRIDHILASGEVRASSTLVGGEQASEHSPVVADIGF